MVLGGIHVRVNRREEKLSVSSVVMSVSTFVQQPGQSTRDLSTLFFGDIFMFFNSLPEGNSRL